MEIRLAIVGSRDMSDTVLFAKGVQEAITQWGRPDAVVSGGARGADTLGEQWATKENITLFVFKPDWGKQGHYWKRYTHLGVS